MERNKKDLPVKDTTSTTPLTKHDHQVINYIARFIPFALLKKFTKRKSPVASIYVKLLKSWKINKLSGDSFVGYDTLKTGLISKAVGICLNQTGNFMYFQNN